MEFITRIFPDRTELKRVDPIHILIFFILTAIMLIVPFLDGNVGKRDVVLSVFTISVLAILFLKVDIYFMLIVLIIGAAFLTKGSYYRGFISYFDRRINYFNTEILLVFFVLIYILKKLIKKDRTYNFTSLHPYILMFFIFFSISIFHSLFKGNYWFNVLWDSRVYIRGLLIFLIAVDVIKNKDQVDGLVKLIFVFILVSDLYAIYQYKFVETTWEVGAGRYRVSSTMFHPNIYAGVLELVIPILISYLLYEKGKVRLLYFVVLAFSFVSLILTFSRGGLIATIIGSFIVLYKFNKKIAMPIILVVLVVLSISTMYVTTQGILYRQLSTFTQVSQMRNLSVAIRYVEYRNMWRTFVDNPWFGWGWGGREIPGFLNINTYRISHHVLPDSKLAKYNDHLWLDIAHKGGIFITILITIIIFKGIWLINRITKSKNKFVRKVSVGLVGGLVGFMVNQMVDNFIRRNITEVFFWTFMAVGMFLYLNYKNTIEGSNE